MTIRSASYAGEVASYAFQPPELRRTERVACDAPAWLETITLDETFLLCVGETPNAVLSVFRETANGLQLHTSAQVGGDGAVSIATVSNYASGSVSVLDLARDGTLGTPHTITFHRSGHGRVADRQEMPHAHQVMPTPDQQYILVCDLGSDRIHMVRVGGRAHDAALATSVPVPDGSGPRHLVFHETTAYVVMELSLEVQAFTWDGPKLSAQGAAVPVRPPQKHTDTLAEVAVSSDGSFVYVSCRGDPHEDVLAALPRAADGTLGAPVFYACGGRVPRHFALSTDERWVVVANQGSETLALLSRDGASGALKLVGTQTAGPVNYAGFI
ncbi:hypothetical protein MBRA1_002134 [Malassezia brasiliensis]|uniref:6-phosphogluconolactonase n=1 Tax=Malassezia brasiliensis TaxID=1821822 RepID=A0AAF0DVD6_9BASI|nr:hypothetical protein MBRA1_002134 [Malassezia brasiliensis]